MYRKILVAVDGSPTSDQALHEAIKLLRDESQLLVLTVVDNPLLNFAAPYGVNYDQEALRHALRTHGEVIVKQAGEQLALQGISAEVRLLDLHEQHDHHEHDIASAINIEAHRWGADLIVIGTHGRRGIKRLLLGSVAEQLVRQATLPVLLVRGKE